MKLPTIQVRLKSVSPLSQSRRHYEDKNAEEDDGQYDRRTWRSHLHTNDDDNIVIPNMSFKFCFDDAAQRLSITKKGQSKWTKPFQSGVLIPEPMDTGLSSEKAWPETIEANADGRRGSGKKVPRTYPMISEWEGTLEILCINPEIYGAEKNEKLHLVTRIIEFAGACVGVGRFAPRVGGYLGRFSLEDLKLLSG